MIYCVRNGVAIRDMEARDPESIAAAEVAQGWHATPEKYLSRLRDRTEGKCAALVADIGGTVVGYIHLYYEPLGGPYRDIPEIVDFGVLEKCRRRGIGALLMDVAEALAAKRSERVCLAVGLHNSYGDAQRMYVKRGYLPDGSGVWFRDAPCPPYSACVNDDDLVLYMCKDGIGSREKRMFNNSQEGEHA